MPIQPNFIERLVLLTLNQGPGLMLDFLGAQAYRVLGVAVRLNIFEALSGGPLTAAETARQVKASERGTSLLLDALESLGYVRQKEGRYINTPMTVKWLLRRSPTSLAGGIPFFDSMVFDRWEHLDESIRRGKPALPGSEWLEQHPNGYRIYEEGMIAIARMAANEVIAKVKLPVTTRRLLDVGGGHGMYSIEFCRRYPGLSAVVFDLPPAVAVARETITAEGMDGRVMAQAGDVWMDDFGDGYDVILLFNLIHVFSPDKNMELLHKIAGALKQGGMVVIMEQIPGKVFGSTTTALARLQALNFFNDMETQTYAYGEIASWLTQVGFSNLHRINLLKTPGFSLLLGTKAG